MKTFSTLISIIFHPLLILTYGIMLTLTFTHLALYPYSMKLAIAGGTFLITALVPGLFIGLLVRNGAAKDLELSDRRERLIPYLILFTSVIACSYFLFRMFMPFWVIALLVGTALALFLALCINFFWKISAHTIGIGGLLGGIMGVAYIHQFNPYWAFIGVLLIGGLVGMSRIFLKRHTSMQAYAGFCLGFICTFVSSFLGYLYLFIK